MLKTRVHDGRFVLALLLALGLLIAACGAPPPTAEDDGGAQPTGAAGTGDATGGGGAGAGQDNSAALEEVYSQIEGLEGEERTNKLVELAAEEDGVNIYSSTNLDDAAPLLEAFTDKYDIEPNYYRASSSDVLRRILQEVDANYPGNDIVMANGPELVLLSQEGQLLPLESPHTADIIEAGVFEDWASVYINTFIAGWNTNNVSDPPETWEQLLTEFDGPLAMELGDWDWFATLTKDYFTTEKGMTEDEVVEMFKQAAGNSVAVDGHTLMAELLVAGEYDAATSLYHHRVAEFISEDAPLAWEPPIRPVILRPNGIGIMKHVQNPATALLWVDFLLSDGQEILAKDFRGPASTKVEGGIPPEYEPMMVNFQAVTEEREKWEGLWAEIVEQSGETIEE